MLTINFINKPSHIISNIPTLLAKKNKTRTGGGNVGIQLLKYITFSKLLDWCLTPLQALFAISWLSLFIGGGSQTVWKELRKLTILVNKVWSRMQLQLWDKYSIPQITVNELISSATQLS